MCPTLRRKRWLQSQPTPWKCYLCGEIVNLDKVVIEHEIPQSRGGVDQSWNYRIACRHCNSKKGKKTPFEYRVGETKMESLFLPPNLPNTIQTAFTLAGVDPILWRAFKSKVALEGKTLRRKILELIEEYVNTPLTTVEEIKEEGKTMDLKTLFANAMDKAQVARLNKAFSEIGDIQETARRAGLEEVDKVFFETETSDIAFLFRNTDDQYVVGWITREVDGTPRGLDGFNLEFHPFED